MNWQDLAGPLIRAGAPVIGNMLGGPFGGMLGKTLGDVLASSLGVPADPVDVGEALQMTPPDELAGKLERAEAAAADIAKAEAEAQAQAIAEAQTTARAEIVAIDPMQRWWRPIYAFELMTECAIVWSLALYDLLFGERHVADFVTGSSGLLMAYWGMRFGVLGVYVQGRSREKEAAITGQTSSDVISQVIKAVKRK